VLKPNELPREHYLLLHREAKTPEIEKPPDGYQPPEGKHEP